MDYKTPDSTDHYLLEKFKRSTRSRNRAAEILLDKYKDWVLHCVLDFRRKWHVEWKLGLDDADDLVQNVLIALIQRLPSFNYDETKTLRGYFVVCIRNEVIRHCQKSGCKEVTSLDLEDWISDKVSELDRLLHQEEIADLLEKLAARSDVSKRDYQVFVRRIIDDVPAKRVAEEFDINPATVDKIVSRMRLVLVKIRRKSK